MHFILRVGKRMRHDIMETMALLNNHKTFVCSPSLHSFHSQRQQSVGPTVTEWNANNDGWSRISFFRLICEDKKDINNLYAVAELVEKLQIFTLHLKYSVIKR